MNYDNKIKNDPHYQEPINPQVPLLHTENNKKIVEKKSNFKYQQGITTVEFSITSTVFFLFLFMIIDFSLYGFVKLTMQHAVREGARYAVTGQVNLDPEDEADRRRAVIEKIKDNSLGLFDKVMDESDIKVTDTDGNIISGFGEAKQSIVVTLNCKWPIINPFAQVILASTHYNFSVATSMRNEYFPGVSP